jgi:hypothetical protein
VVCKARLDRHRNINDRIAGATATGVAVDMTDGVLAPAGPPGPLAESSMSRRCDPVESAVRTWSTRRANEIDRRRPSQALVEGSRHVFRDDCRWCVVGPTSAVIGATDRRVSGWLNEHGSTPFEDLYGLRRCCSTESS